MFLRWLTMVSSSSISYVLMDQYFLSLSYDPTIMVSSNFLSSGKPVVVIVYTTGYHSNITASFLQVELLLW